MKCLVEYQVRTRSAAQYHIINLYNLPNGPAALTIDNGFSGPIIRIRALTQNGA